jgi:hypothetical protein
LLRFGAPGAAAGAEVASAMRRVSLMASDCR